MLRRVKDINKATFRQEICYLQCVLTPPEDLDELVEQFDSQLRTVFDKHAPETTKNVKMRPENAWFGTDVPKARQEKEDSSVSGLKVGL